MADPVALTIGSFDGVHRGHAALVGAARARVGAGGRVTALVFDPHPLTVLNPALAPARLTSFGERRRRLLAAGADDVVRLEPSDGVLGQSPEAFVAWLAERFGPRVIVEGPDFRFGHGRAGDVARLRALGAARGIEVVELRPVEAVLDDHSVVRVSSSLCRWLLGQGRVADAGRVLGRPHVIEGVVVRGDRRGRTIGFPTANVATDVLAPGDGVYAAWAELPDGTMMPAAVNVGARPTFSGAARSLEAHVIRGPEAEGAWSPMPGLPEYGWAIRLHLSAFLRDSARFPGVEALRAQLRRDVERASRLLAASPLGVASAETASVVEPQPA